MRRQQHSERKPETGEAGQDRGEKEQRGPAQHPVGAEQPGQDENTGNDSDQADDDVQNGECRQAQTQHHDVLPHLEWVDATTPDGKWPYMPTAQGRFVTMLEISAFTPPLKTRWRTVA